MPALRLVDLAPAVVKQLPEVEGVAWYRLRADASGVTRVAVPATDVVEAMRARIRALEGKVMWLEAAVEEWEGESVLRRGKTVGGVARGGGESVDGLGGRGGRARGRVRSTVGVVDGGNGGGGKRRSVCGLLEGDARDQGTRTRGIRGVFGGRRARAKAKAALTETRGSQTMPSPGGQEDAAGRGDQARRVEIGTGAVFGWGHTDGSTRQRPTSGRQDHWANGPRSLETRPTYDRVTRASSASLPRGGTVWEATAASQRSGISCADAKLEVGDGVPGSAFRAGGGVGNGNVEPKVAHDERSRVRGYGHDDDDDSGTGVAAFGVGSNISSGRVAVTKVGGRPPAFSSLEDSDGKGGIFKNFIVPDDSDTHLSLKREIEDDVNVTTSPVSSDSGERGGRVQRKDARQELEDDVPPAPDAPIVVPASKKDFAGTNKSSTDRLRWFDGAELGKEAKVDGEALRWSDKLRRAGSGRLAPVFGSTRPISPTRRRL